MGILAKPMGWALSGIYNLVGNYGISLIIFSLLACAILIPLYVSQMKGMAKMQEMQPKIAEIQRKFANDKDRMNDEMAKLQKKEHYNPMMGCLPMLIQLPIIMALFAVLRNPLLYISNDSLIMGVHESFFWMNDLSQPDPWILPIVAGITTFLSTLANPSQAGAQQQSGISNAIMKYLFPVMIIWMARSFPAGVSLYWVIRNVFTMAQTWIYNISNRKKALRAQVEADVMRRYGL